MKNHPDYILVVAVSLLIVLGIIILASVSAPLSRQMVGNTYYFLTHQLLFGLLPGIFAGFLTFRISLETLKKWSLKLLLINLILMAMVFLPYLGVNVDGASRWLKLGFLTVQPSEFLKLTFLIYLALWLANRFSNQKKFIIKKEFSQTFIAFLIIMGTLALFLILQPDISTLGVIVFSSVLMYFLVGTPLRHLLLMIILGIIALIPLVKIAPYRLRRILVFFNPDIDPLGMAYQIKQALIAVGSGGIFGLGLGMSAQKYGFLPQAMSDSIFAVFAEEAGFFGALILIFLFLAFLWRGIIIACQTKDNFSQLLAVGITSWIIIQAFVNISSMIGILPLTGIPLPFISYGGSALVAELAAVGLLLNISKNN